MMQIRFSWRPKYYTPNKSLVVLKSETSFRLEQFFSLRRIIAEMREALITGTSSELLLNAILIYLYSSYASYCIRNSWYLVIFNFDVFTLHEIHWHKGRRWITRKNDIVRRNGIGKVVTEIQIWDVGDNKRRT